MGHAAVRVRSRSCSTENVKEKLTAATPGSSERGCPDKGLAAAQPPRPDAAAPLFSATARRRELAGLRRTVGTVFGIDFVAMDINDARSVATVAERFARARVNGSAAAGRRFALDAAANRMIAGEGMAPVVALAATGAGEKDGQRRRFALLVFNARNNAVMDTAFGDLRPLFGAEAGRQIERMTFLHEAAHVVVQHAEQAGADAWSDAVQALDEAGGRAGEAIRSWAASDDGALAHPEIRHLLLAEADLLDALQARVRAGESGLCYDADALRRTYQELKERPAYRNFQEHVADAFMAISLRTKGVNVSAVVARARAAADVEHDTRVTLLAVGQLPRSFLVGNPVGQRMARAVALVCRVLGMEAPGKAREMLATGEEPDGRRVPRRMCAGRQGPFGATELQGEEDHVVQGNVVSGPPHEAGPEGVSGISGGIGRFLRT